MIKAALLLFLFLGFAGLVGLTALFDPTAGIPATGGIAAVFAPNAPALDAAAQAKRSEAQALDAQAQQAREIAAQATESARLWREQATQAAQRQTQAVASTSAAEGLAATQRAQAATEAAQAHATAQIVSATLEAGYAQGTATARPQQTQDAIELAALSGKATEIANDRARDADWKNLKLEAASSTAWFWANWSLWLFVVVVAVIVAVVFAGFRWLGIQQGIAVGAIPMDANGNSHAAVIGGKLYNPNQMTAAVMDPRALAPVTDAEQAYQLAKTYQARSSIWALGRNGYKKDAYQAAQQLTQSVGAGDALPEPQESTDPAPWDLTGWTGKALPLGVSFNGSGIELDPQHTPNLIVASTSDGGKTMRALRPLTAEALASGWYVITANIKGGDFAPFKGHANLTDVNGQSAEVADLLESVLAEVERRNKILKEAGISTYYRLTNAEQYVGPRLLVVIDEIVSLIYGAPDKATVSRIWKASINIASKCRAMGVMMVLAGTDITYRLGNDWLALRGNCGRMAFRMYDKDMSHALLNMGGAETLQGAQFIALLNNGPVRGVAFQPGDDDIRRFLAQRTVEVAVPAFLGAKPAPLKVEQDVYSHDTIRLAETIMDHWHAGASKSAMARAAGFTQYGGSFAAQIDVAVKYLVEKYGTTTSTTSIGSTFTPENGAAD